MKLLTISFCAATLITTQSIASGCTDMAAFDTKVNSFLETASLDTASRIGINQLSIKCRKMHNTGVPVSDIKSCTEALELVKIN
jgi:hypothetical protein